MTTQLRTIAEIAKQLQIPESTARFYRDRFEKYIPTVGSGRNKRYRPETAEVLRYIAEAYKRNEPQWQIEDALSRMVATNVDVSESTAVATAAAQQQPVFDENIKMAMMQMGAALQVMADQKEEISELRKQIHELEQKHVEQQSFNDWAKNRDELTTQLLNEIRENRRKKWWRPW